MSLYTTPTPTTTSTSDESPPLDTDSQSSSSSSSTTTTASPLILYRPPTAMSILRTAAINLVLPFINGLMLGFGELFAHELAFRLGWSGTRVFPIGRRTLGPGMRVEGQLQSGSERRGKRGEREEELMHTASLE